MINYWKMVCHLGYVATHILNLVVDTQIDYSVK